MRLRPPRSTFGLVTLVSLLLGGASLLLAAGVFATSHEALEMQLNHRIEAETAALTAHYEQGGSAALASMIVRREMVRSPSGLGYILVDASGRRLAGRLNAAAPQPGWLEFLYVAREDGGRDISQALTTRLPDGARLVVAADRGPIDAADRTIVQVSAVTFGIMLALGLGGAWALGGIVRRRLDRINTSAEAIIDGDLARRMPVDGSDSEFDRLSITLNRMLDRNAELMETLQQVSSDIAHDLRTPLARLHQSLDSALREGRDADGYRLAIEAAAGRAGEMLEIFAALLRISEVESLQVREGFQPVDLSNLVQQMAETFGPDVEASGHRLAAPASCGIAVQGDRRLLSQMLVNLIENAVRHTPRGTEIRVTLERTETGVVLAVEDSGPGVAPADRERVLRRFARLEKSRSTPGHGLGLSLVAAIARAHYAALSLEDAHPGLVAKVTFPP